MSFALQQYYEHNHMSRALYGTSWRLENRKAVMDQMVLDWKKTHGQDASFLDIGCRDGSFCKDLNLSCRTVGIDIDVDALLRYKLAHQEATVKVMDCNEYLNFTDESFDLIIAGELIEHLINPQLFLSEIHRILKKGGIFIGSTPNAFRWDKRLLLLIGKDPKVFSDATHTQYFSYQSLKDVLIRNFAEVEIVNHPVSILHKKFNKFLADGFVWKTQK